MKLNKLIKEKSSEAQLVLLNLPPPAKDESGDYHCILCISSRRELGVTIPLGCPEAKLVPLDACMHKRVA